MCGKIRKAFLEGWKNAERHETFEKCKEKLVDWRNKNSSLTIVEPNRLLKNIKK